MINNVVVVGRLTKDIDLRYTQSNKAWAGFKLAIQRNFKNAQGEYEADFIDCQVFGVGAEYLSKNTKKGMLIGVQGRLQSRNYEKDGRRIYVTEIIANSVRKLEFEKSENTSNNYADPYEMERFDGGEYQISDDELPF